MAGCYGSSSYDRWLESCADAHYGCDDDDNLVFNVRVVNPNNFRESKSYEVYAETIEEAADKVGIPWSYRPKLKNGKPSKAKPTFFSPNEELGWIKVGKKTIATIELED